ncbi:MAG: tetraacyldisaccharide 4'-kinase [Bacteroidaceae bacterium]|nr:tetraacyldisaccharide 4'-kinase [Bacteroidaceae bacterium]
MKNDTTDLKIRRWLLPLSWLYGLGVTLRNKLFDMDVLHTQRFPIPVISVGNLTVGGTGKTPHVEYLVRLLSPHYKVAVLSRGYKRKSKGYVLATSDTPMHEIGDEPWQIKQKFPDIYVAVDKVRTHGITRLMNDEETKDVEVVLLDDAYQHRYVTPTANILLVDCHRMIPYDKLLPAGSLREPKESMGRANIVIVTKCPQDIKPLDFRVAQKLLKLRPYQKLYFSTMRYKTMHQLFGEEEKAIGDLRENVNVMLLTGIASPGQMQEDLEQYTKHITPLSFPDHHYFTADDAELINRTFSQQPHPRLIITTEKDATRLSELGNLSEEVRQSLFVLPIEINILRDEQENFNEKIKGYVLKNSRNSVLAANQNERKAHHGHHLRNRSGQIGR